MRIYTRSGDKGETSLVYGKRVKKSHIRVEAYGTCDEANAMLGVAMSYLNKEDDSYLRELYIDLKEIQNKLFYVGSELSTPKGKEAPWKMKKEDVDKLEKLIDKLDRNLTPLKQFILPSGSIISANLHATRTVVRRCERLIVDIDDLDNQYVVAYMNRLSDLLFVAARYVNEKLDIQDITLDVK